MSDQCADDDNSVLWYCFIATQCMCVMLLCISSWQQDRWGHRHEIVNREHELKIQREISQHNERMTTASHSTSLVSETTPVSQKMEHKNAPQWDFEFDIPRLRDISTASCFDELPPIWDTENVRVELLAMTSLAIKLRVTLYEPEDGKEIPRHAFDICATVTDFRSAQACSRT